MRLRSALKSKALIFADVGVKHAAPLAGRSLDIETRDLAERGLADAAYRHAVTGPVSRRAWGHRDRPRGNQPPAAYRSGATPENIERVLPKVNGLIVGSYFKKDGAGHNFVDQARVERFVRRFAELRG